MSDTAPTHRAQAESISYCYEDFIRSVIYLWTFITYLSGGQILLKEQKYFFLLSRSVRTHQLSYHTQAEPSIRLLSV